MSHHSRNSTPTKGTAARLLIQLTGAANHRLWRRSIQAYMFSKFHNVNMDKLGRADTLDLDYFKKHEDFKADFKAAVASDDGDKTANDPFVNSPKFLDQCFGHAISTGDGFTDWLYDTFTCVANSLSAKIQLQTAGVRLGDLIALLAAVKLAVHEIEVFDPDVLDIAFTSCTMDGEGGNDLMTYLSALAGYVLRLEAVNKPPSV